MTRKLLSILVLCCFGFTQAAPAQSLDRAIAGLGSTLTKALSAQGFKSVAAIDFTDLQGQPTELGRFLADQLTVEIVSGGTVSMVDRANIKSILAEHQLTEEGLVRPENAKKLGEFAGVDVLLVGSVTALDTNIVLTVRAVATSSSRLVAAGKATFTKTSDIQQLLNRSVAGAGSTGPVGRATQSYQEPAGIASKDLGSLRVIVKSVLPVQLNTPYGRRNGVRVSFELISRETQRPMLVGLNAKQEHGYNRGNCRLGQGLRATAVDSKGEVYNLPNENVSGLSVIGVGCDDMTGYDPSQIGSLLAQQDRNGNRGQERGEYVYGSLSTIAPGQSLSVAMNFVQSSSSGIAASASDFFEIEAEFVVGLANSNAQKYYSLQTLIFSRLGPSSK